MHRGLKHMVWKRVFQVSGGHLPMNHTFLELHGPRIRLSGFSYVTHGFEHTKTPDLENKFTSYVIMGFIIIKTGVSHEQVNIISLAMKPYKRHGSKTGESCWLKPHEFE